MDISKLVNLVGPDWAELLKGFMEGGDNDDFGYKAISAYLKGEVAEGNTFWPEGPKVFRAFIETPLSEMRVILLGQDPYFKAGFATGLAFGHEGARKDLPISLEKIFDGIEDDVYHGLDFNKPEHDMSLTTWSSQGVLLLNSSLTVKEGEANSHTEVWKPFMQYLIMALQQLKTNTIWIALGATAKGYVKDINPFRNFVFTAEHPSAAARDNNRAWNHNNVFTKANLVIKINSLGPTIKW